MNKKVQRTTLIIMLLIGFSGRSITANAQSLPDSTIAKLDKLFAAWNVDDAPGCAAGIVRGDKLVYAKGVGLANLESRQPNTPNTIFYMCSVSKQFAGYAVALLAGNGKINLDEDIRTYLPRMSDFGGKKITVRNLVNHTSGIRDDIGLAQFYGLGTDGILSQQLAVKILERQRTLNFTPGEKFSYSNSNYVLLAEIVKAVTGQNFKDFTDSVIFKPLGMSASAFVDDHTQVIAGRAMSYEKEGEVFHNAMQNVYTLGDGGLFTSVNDMAKWVANFYQPKVGTLKDIGLMTTQGKLNDGTVIPYAMGINVSTDRGYRRLTHNGGLAGYRTIIAIYPELKTGFYIFGNAGDGEVYNKINQLAELLIPEKSVAKRSEIPKAEPTTAIQASTDAEKWAGNYIAANGYKVAVTAAKGLLYINKDAELAQETKGVFHLKARPSVKYHFMEDIKTKNKLLKLFSPVLQKPIEMEHVAEGDISGLKLADYTGSYYSDELDYNFNLSFKNNQLFVSDKFHDPAKCTIFGQKHLFSDYGLLNHMRVIRNDKGRITALELNSGDTAGLIFKKQPGSNN